MPQVVKDLGKYLKESNSYQTLFVALITVFYQWIASGRYEWKELGTTMVAAGGSWLTTHISVKAVLARLLDPTSTMPFDPDQDTATPSTTIAPGTVAAPTVPVTDKPVPQEVQEPVAEINHGGPVV